MKIFPHLLATACLLFPATLQAQKTNTWRDHFSYAQGVAALDVNGRTVYATTMGLVFNEENGCISKVAGLSTVGISAACYDAPSGCIYVGYIDGSIDVLSSTEPRQLRTGNYTHTITAWRDFVAIGRKAITCFLRLGDRMLVGTASQILEVKNRQILANYSIDERNDSLAIRRLALIGDSLAALTTKGVYAIHKDDAQRYYYLSWHRSSLALAPLAPPDEVPGAPYSPRNNRTVALDEMNGTVVAVADGSLSVLPHRGAWQSLVDVELAAAADVKINPQNAAQIFVATASGVAEVAASDAAPALLGKDLRNRNVRTLAFNGEQTLLAFASNSAQPVNVRKPDGSWLSLPCDALKNATLANAAFVGNAFWGIAGEKDLFAYATGTDITSAADDQATTFPVASAEVESFAVGNTYSLAVDHNSAVWIGTDKGVLCYAESGSPFAAAPKGECIRIPDDINGMAAYVLEHERTTVVTIDGANRKWFGTRDAGVFLQGPDGRERLQNFNAQNSPLPSNTVLDIAVNSLTGEVLIATDQGLVGFFGDATAGKANFGEAKIYPNPVRPNMSQLTITNLMENASVKIIDVSGNLVFSGTANGGTITWNVRNLAGHRVATGVYVVLLADSAGEETRQMKVMVVN